MLRHPSKLILTCQALKIQGLRQLERPKINGHQSHRWGDLREEPSEMTYGKLHIKKSQGMYVVGVLVDSFTDGCLVTSS